MRCAPEHPKQKRSTPQRASFLFAYRSGRTSSSSLIWSTFLSIGFCLKEGISLKIDTLISLFPKKVQAVILLLGDVVMTVFFLYLLPSAWEFAYASVENGQTSAACGIPMYFVQGSLMVGFALAAFRAAQGVWSNLRTLLQKGDE